MNDPLVAQLSRKWAERALQTVPGSGNEAIVGRIEWMYLSAFGRLPTAQESEAAATYLVSQASQRDVTTENPDLWANLSHVLVNTKEFIFLR